MTLLSLDGNTTNLKRRRRVGPTPKVIPIPRNTSLDPDQRPARRPSMSVTMGRGRGREEEGRMYQYCPLPRARYFLLRPRVRVWVRAGVRE